MKAFALALATLSPICWAQTAATGSARSTGSCNSAISGSDNHVVITCTGVSNDKAAQLLRVMNEILARELDPKKVYSQLEQLHSDISDLADVVNPLSKASPATRALVKESENMNLSCSSTLRSFQAKRMAAKIAAFDNTASAKTSQPRSTRTSDDLNQQELAEYQKSLAPRLTAWRTRVLPQLPGTSAARDYASASTYSEFSQVCADVTSLANTYTAKVFSDLREAGSKPPTGRSSYR